jgi:hypothetical protein
LWLAWGAATSRRVGISYFVFFMSGFTQCNVR